ncbi:MAG: hypothetical protein ABIF10_00235 [Candidatus Woesearchaeota archaeon]
MQKRGDSATNIILFIGVMLAVFIGFYWTARLNFATPFLIKDVEKALVELQVELDAACNSPYYESKVNPSLDYGILFLTDSEICINSNFCRRFNYDSDCSILPGITRCRPVICNTGLKQEFDLHSITYLHVKKDENLEVSGY